MHPGQPVDSRGVRANLPVENPLRCWCYSWQPLRPAPPSAYDAHTQFTRCRVIWRSDRNHVPHITVWS
eukprot:1410436-Rhodomonas_salina.1